MKWKYKTLVILISGILFIIGGILLSVGYHSIAGLFPIIIGRTMFMYWIIETFGEKNHSEGGVIYIPIFGELGLIVIIILFSIFSLGRYLYKDIPDVEV